MSNDLSYLPKVTVLVAAWNEIDNIARFINSYRALSYPSNELVLCAGGTDGTLEATQVHDGDSIVVLRQEPGEGKQRALRKGFTHATGQIIVLTDADCLMNHESFMRLITPIIRGAAAVTTGTSKPRSSQMSHPFVYYQYALQRPRRPLAELRQRQVNTVLGRNSAILRAALIDAGAFSDDVAIGTDSYLSKKITAQGYPILFVPDSVVETEFPFSLSQYIRQRARWSRNGIVHNLNFRFYRRAGRALLIPAASLGMFLLPLFSFRFGKVVLYGWATMVAYAFCNRVRFIGMTKASGIPVPTSIYWKMPAYFLAEWAARALALVQMLSRSARKQW